MRPTRSRGFVPALIAAAIALTACGGGDGDPASSPDTSAADEPSNEPSGDGTDASPAAGDPVGGGAASNGTPVTELLPTHVDLIGETVVDESEIESNLLPAVVLDDLTTGRKVNFRNLVPQDKPILLWMWAPF